MTSDPSVNLFESYIPLLKRRKIECSSPSFQLNNFCSRCKDLEFDASENLYTSETEKKDHIRRHLLMDRDAHFETVKEAKRHSDFDFLYADCFLEKLATKSEQLKAEKN